MLVQGKANCIGEAMTADLLRYEKLAADLAGMIADGMLRHGDRLPSVRRLSEDSVEKLISQAAQGRLMGDFLRF